MELHFSCNDAFKAKLRTPMRILIKWQSSPAVARIKVRLVRKWCFCLCCVFVVFAECLRCVCIDQGCAYVVFAQTRDLSKILPAGFLGQKFYTIFNSFSDKNTKKWVKMEKICTTDKKFYTAAGSDGRDQSHQCVCTVFVLIKIVFASCLCCACVDRGCAI